MQNLAWKIVLVLAVLVLCIYAIFPPEQKIRLGKDLQGGTSLIYLVDMPDGADRAQVLAQTIEVLKERINPQGVLDISIQPLGADRLEVVMPLPNEKVLALRKQYDAALSDLLQIAQIKPMELDEALANNKAVERFGGGDASRSNQITTLQDAFNRMHKSRATLNDAKAAGTVDQALNTVEQEAADAAFDYEEMRAKVDKTSLDRARIVRVLNLSQQRETKKDQQNAQQSTESPREIALAGLKSEFPHLSTAIDTTVAAFDQYQAKRTTLDDPEDLMRLLRGAGVLEFHIAVQNSNPQGINAQQMRTDLKEAGPDHVQSSVARWYPINDLKQWYDKPQELAALEADPEGYFANRRGLIAAKYEGTYYVLLYTTPDKGMVHDADHQWSVIDTRPTVDDLGRPAVLFQLDDAGGLLMSRMTGLHVNQPMAIVLDGQVYSTANIMTQIGKHGTIQGDFAKAEIDYLTRVLAAGALSARLSEQPIAMNTLGPSLGADNLYRGMVAFILSVIVTVVIMMVYYFFAGFIANVALMINAIIIFGTMALMQGSFTLPGLAGMALSIAMAVDANVLIYERIREECVNNHEDLRTAIRLGYQRALSAIVDGNVAHLITCVVLLYTATTEVKGFALTMIIGVIATLFTALFVTRILFTIYTEYFGARTLPMLPTVFPGIHKSLEPHIDWIRKRYVFFGISLVACVISLALVAMRGSNMLDTEFRGGLAMTMQTRLARDGEPKDKDNRLLLSRPEVEAEIHRLGADAGAAQPILHQLESAVVLTVGEMTTDYKASRFQIKVGNPPSVDSEKTIADTVVDAIARRFGDRLDVSPSLTFKGAGAADHAAYTFPIQSDTLGAAIKRPEYTQSVARFRGGVAIVLDDISPPISRTDALARIKRLRDQPDFIRARDRESEVIGLTPVDLADPSRGYTSIAVVVVDPAISKRDFDLERWDAELAPGEWKLVSTALATGSSLQEVASFSAAMAQTLAANAVVAVALSLIGMLVYIWLRFGSLRYSFATVIAVTHNVIICLGALALTHWLAGTQFSSWILLDEFRIDLNVIAALLTIIGYSLNDTIVILDRIRENRGKRMTVTPEIVNNSINQTFSRTVLTGGSTIIASLILYIMGGTGIQPFAFTFLIGLLVGTYSSVTVAAPLVIGGPPAGVPATDPKRFPGAMSEGTVAQAPA